MDLAPFGFLFRSAQVLYVIEHLNILKIPSLSDLKVAGRGMLIAIQN